MPEGMYPAIADAPRRKLVATALAAARILKDFSTIIEEPLTYTLDLFPPMSTLRAYRFTPNTRAAQQTDNGNEILLAGYGQAPSPAQADSRPSMELHTELGTNRLYYLDGEGHSFYADGN